MIAGHRIEPSCFGGLLRRGPDGWRWHDGDAEPRMEDVACDRADLVCREQDGAVLVEVPLCLAETFDPLVWILEAAGEGRFAVDAGSGSPAAAGRAVGSTATCPPEQRRRVAATGVMRVLVPREVWSGWCCDCPLLPVWDPGDEAGLQRRAIAHGWRAPTGGR